MEKRKVFKISIIDKEISRTEFDRNTFYTSDSELTLVFKLIEKDYSYDHGEILLYNEDDESFVTRPITKQENDFVYELDLDIIPHYGKWQAQLQLIKDGDVYTSKPFEFSIVNDLSNLAPQPTLTDINNWSTLKQSANELIDEMQDIIVSVERSELERVSKENYRQQAESERSNKENERQKVESERVKQENKRQKAESARDNNEEQRRIAEFERVDKETTRRQAERLRQSTFETNETERQTTFETNETERQSAEIIRIENENQRNLTSVDEFIKLQDSIGGRNLLIGSADMNLSPSGTYGNYTYLLRPNIISIFKHVKLGDTLTFSFDVWAEEDTNLSFDDSNFNTGLRFGSQTIIAKKEIERVSFTKTLISTNLQYTTLWLMYIFNNNNGIKFWIDNLKIEKGTQSTPYTKAPEDYTIVSKEDYYKHIKLVNNAKDSQFNQLKQAVIALGGTI